MEDNGFVQWRGSPNVLLFFLDPSFGLQILDHPFDEISLRQGGVDLDALFANSDIALSVFHDDLGSRHVVYLLSQKKLKGNFMAAFFWPHLAD